MSQRMTKPLFYIILFTIALIVASMSVTESVLTILANVGIAISGWVAFGYQYFAEKPKIKGKIIQVMQGNMPNPNNQSERLTSFVLFLYLTNTRKNAVHLRNYDLEIDFGNGFEKMKIVRGIAEKMIFHFETENGEITIPDFTKGLIYKQSKSIEFGTPFYGYLLFAGDIKYYKQKAKCFKMTVTDVFDHKHVFTANPEKDFVDIFYLQELFGVKIPVKNPVGTTTNSTIQESSSLISGNEVK